VKASFSCEILRLIVKKITFKNLISINSNQSFRNLTFVHKQIQPLIEDQLYIDHHFRNLYKNWPWKKNRFFRFIFSNSSKFLLEIVFFEVHQLHWLSVYFLRKYTAYLEGHFDLERYCIVMRNKSESENHRFHSRRNKHKVQVKFPIKDILKSVHVLDLFHYMCFFSLCIIFSKRSNYKCPSTCRSFD